MISEYYQWITLAVIWIPAVFFIVKMHQNDW